MLHNFLTLDLHDTSVQQQKRQAEWTGKEYREKTKNKIELVYNPMVHQILALYAVLILSPQKGDRELRNCWTQKGYSEHGLAPNNSYSVI